MYQRKTLAQPVWPVTFWNQKSWSPGLNVWALNAAVQVRCTGVPVLRLIDGDSAIGPLSRVKVLLALLT